MALASPTVTLHAMYITPPPPPGRSIGGVSEKNWAWHEAIFYVPFGR